MDIPEPAIDRKSLPPGMRNEKLRYQANPHLKDEAYFVKYGAETSGEYTKLKVTVGGGGGVALHYHNMYTETFTAEEGELGVVIDNKTLILKPGESTTVPLRTKHRFFNPSPDQEIRCQVVLAPANEGFEKSVYIVYGMARDSTTKPSAPPGNFLQMCLIMEMGDMSFPGIFMILGPFINLFAAYARWRGEQARLLKKYWYDIWARCTD